MGLKGSSAAALYSAIHDRSEEAATVLLAAEITEDGLRAFLKEASASEDVLPAMTEITVGG